MTWEGELETGFTLTLDPPKQLAQLDGAYFRAGLMVLSDDAVDVLPMHLDDELTFVPGAEEDLMLVPRVDG